MNSVSLDNNKTKGNPFRVMVVDDSAIIRGFLGRYLSDDPSIEVVATANNGEVALKQLEKHDIEAVVLDIEMPVMNGLTALPKMISMQSDLMIVMASTLTRKNAEVSLKALQEGAVDYVPKPETARSVNASIDFRRELVEKVKAWAGRRRKKLGQPLPETQSPRDLSAGTHVRSGHDAQLKKSSSRAATSPNGFVAARRSPKRSVIVTSSGRGESEDLPKTPPSLETDKSIPLRKGSMRKPQVLAIGSSTGGPQALMKFFAGFKKAPTVPVVLTQHMPENFTAILAEHIKQATGWQVQEACDGTPLKAGEVYVAPGGKHMKIVKDGPEKKVALTDDPPENFCKPAVDPMLRSLVEIYGERVLTVILTGMGHDGLKGSREVTKAGGTVLAQNEETSVVWGMPGAVATAGVCTEVLPVEALGAATEKRLQGGI